MPMVDIGLGQLAMHSAMETASCADAEYMAKAVAEYYNTPNLPAEGRGVEAGPVSAVIGRFAP